MWKISTVFPIQIGLAYIENLNINRDQGPFQELLSLAEEQRSKYGCRNIGDIEGVQQVRKLFRFIGLDPTKHRPSSEALLRRALKSLEFYSINTLVDIGNWCSLDFLLPICVYDARRVQGDVTVRLGREGESYLGHNERVVHLADRFLLADESGPFGSPITDSVRTAVSTSTSSSYLIIFSPAELASLKLQERLKTFTTRTLQYCGGNILEITIIK